MSFQFPDDWVRAPAQAAEKEKPKAKGFEFPSDWVKAPQSDGDSKGLKEELLADPSMRDPTQAEAKSLFEAEQNRSWPDTFAAGLDTAGAAIGGALGYLGDAAKSGIKSWWQNQLQQAHQSQGKGFGASLNPVAVKGAGGNLQENVAPTVVEGAGRGAYDLAYLGNKIGNNLYDKTTGDNAAKYHARLIQDLDQQRMRQQVTEGSAFLTTDNPELQKKINPGMAELSSVALDPSAFIPAGAAAKGASMAEKALAKGAGKAIEKTAGAVQTGARGVKELVKKPGEVLKSVMPGDAGASGLIGGAAGGYAQSLGVPVFETVAGLKAAQGGSALVENAANATRLAAQTAGDSQFSRLHQLARNPEAPKWLKVVASAADKTPIEGVAKATKAVAGGAAKGAAIGGTLGALSAENAEEMGQMAGAGGAFGGIATTAVRPFGKSARVMEAKRGDIERFVTKLKEQGTPDEIIAKLSDDVVLPMATFNTLLEGKTTIQVLDGPTYASTAKEKGSSGYYDRNTKSIVINADAKRGVKDTFLHEVTHALEDSAIADLPAMRTAIDAVVGTPERLEQAKFQYAQKLVGGKPIVSASDPAKMQQAIDAHTAEVKAQVERLNASSQQNFGNPDHWVYSEIFAEAGLREMAGRDILTDVAAMDSIQARRLDWEQSLFEKLGVVFGYKKTSGEAPSKAGSSVFSAKFDHVVESPQLRNLVREYVKRRQNFIQGHSKIPDAGSPVSKDMVGRHPALPVRDLPDGTKGNDFYTVQADGTVINRTAAQVKQIERSRAQEVEAVTTPIFPKLHAGLDDTDPYVKPRLQIGGKVMTTGTKLGQWFYDLTRFGPEAKANARLFETAIEGGQTMNVWYQAAGTGRGSTYSESLRVARGGLAVSNRDVIPFGFWLTRVGDSTLSNGKSVKTGGNINVFLLDLTSANKKIARWQGEGKLERWGGDAEAFKRDLFTYLKNVADGKPGETGIGTDVKNQANSLVIGANMGFKDANPLREFLRGADRDGVIRTFRLDRIEAVKAVPSDPIRVDYPRMVRNLSPDTGGKHPKRGDSGFQPWHDIYAYLTAHPSSIQRILEGELDHLAKHPDYGPAIEKVKKDFGKSNASE